MKTKPYGVRFNEEDLLLLENEMGVTSPQRAVNFLFQYWREHRVGGVVSFVKEPIIGSSVSDVRGIDALSEKSLPSAQEIMLEKLRKAVVQKVDIDSKEIGLTKFQLEMRKKKFGY